MAANFMPTGKVSRFDEDAVVGRIDRKMHRVKDDGANPLGNVELQVYSFY